MSKLKLSSNASGSGNVTLQSPNTNSDFTVTVPSGTGALPLMKLETAVTASGTSVDFTGIPSWAKRITVMFNGVSTNGTSNYLIQLGDAGGIETTGYASYSSLIGVSAVVGGANYTAGFGLALTTAAAVVHGQCSIALLSGNVWTIGGMLARSDTAIAVFICGSKTLSDTLTQVRITTVNGTDTFDAGTINILYEG